MNFYTLSLTQLFDVLHCEMNNIKVVLEFFPSYPSEVCKYVQDERNSHLKYVHPFHKYMKDIQFLLLKKTTLPSTYISYYCYYYYYYDVLFTILIKDLYSSQRILVKKDYCCSHIISRATRKSFRYQSFSNTCHINI